MRTSFLFIAAVMVAVNAFAYEKHVWNYETGQESRNSNSAQDLDIYYPETGESPYPALIWLSYRIGDAEAFKGEAYTRDAPELFEAALQRGYAVVIPNCRRNGSEGQPLPFHDIKAVVRFLRNNGYKYDDLGIDTSFIAVAGSGMGGLMATLMGYSREWRYESWWEGNVGKFLYESSSVDAVADWDGVHVSTELLDFAYIYNRMLGCQSMDCSTDYGNFLWTVFTARTSNLAPTILFHGAQDAVIKKAETDGLYNALHDKLGDDCEYYVHNGGFAMSGITDLAYYVGKMMDFFDRIRAQKAANVPTEPVVKKLPGRFAVSPTDTVVFAQGNLQYRATTDTWRLADNQWDFLCQNNGYDTPIPEWIDLFGFGRVSEPWQTSVYPFDYTIAEDITATIACSDYDWTHQPIENSGGYAWRLLSAEEWDYLLHTRENAAQLQGQATVNGFRGYVLLPDNWKSNSSFTPTPDNYEKNEYNLSWWQNSFEAKGAVFLPATGYRYGTELMEQERGDSYYWTGDLGENDDVAQAMNFRVDASANMTEVERSYGNPVRPVRHAEADESEDVRSNAAVSQVRKAVVDGHVYILRNGKTYTLQGQEL